VSVVSGPLELPRDARETLERWRAARERIVFTNGVFDLVHFGHVEYLEDARTLGDRLVIGVNADASVRRLKGPARPILPETERMEFLRALECVDLVLLFEEDTPLRLIEAVGPDVLVKGGDWPVESIVGREIVEARGGRVLSIPLREGFGTTNRIERILAGKSALET
jgi:rfaE bifunctional protein nucleotidyltransferase chain/domain